MVSYLLHVDDAFLHGMGVARSKLPSRAEWIDSVLRDHDQQNHEKDRAYLAWVHGGAVIAHSSINKIEVGKGAFIHLHMWSREHRHSGLRTRFFELSAARFVNDFSLQCLYCEPSADNPASQ